MKYLVLAFFILFFTSGCTSITGESINLENNSQIAYSHLNSSLDQEKQLIEQLNEELSEKQSEIDSLKNQLDQKDTEIKILKENLTNDNLEITKLRQAFTKLRQALNPNLIPVVDKTPNDNVDTTPPTVVYVVVNGVKLLKDDTIKVNAGDDISIKAYIVDDVSGINNAGFAWQVSQNSVTNGGLYSEGSNIFTKTMTSEVGFGNFGISTFMERGVRTLKIFATDKAGNNGYDNFPIYIEII